MLGAIADDFTGATDLATMLRRSGHRVAVVIEDGGLEDRTGLDAIVVALKTRTAAPESAAADSLHALERLRAWGATRFYVKYCSTFDSTERGNIGPVLDAVTDAVGARRCVIVPSLPANGRTVYRGHLFVGGELLENSSMSRHPLTPMTQSRVASLLRPQTPHSVSEIAHETVRAGAPALLAALKDSFARYIVVDAIDDDDLAVIAAATANDAVVSGGSGLALGMTAAGNTENVWTSPGISGRVVLCGSASAATRGQIAHAARSQPVRQIDLQAAARRPEEEAAALASWVSGQPSGSIPVVCAVREPGDVRQSVEGVDTAPLVEHVLSAVARRLVDAGAVSALIVAGGESSGAVVRGLGIQTLHIGPELAPGVCWADAATASGKHIAVALKSGNFGREDLFTAGWDVLA